MISKSVYKQQRWEISLANYYQEMQFNLKVVHNISWSSWGECKLFDVNDWMETHVFLSSSEALRFSITGLECEVCLSSFGPLVSPSALQVLFKGLTKSGSSPFSSDAFSTSHKWAAEEDFSSSLAPSGMISKPYVLVPGSAWFGLSKNIEFRETRSGERL